jgi:flagellar motility protein MotE (MotC chaperone)
MYPGSGVTLLASLSPAVAASLIGEMDPKKAKVIVEEMWRMREVAGG